MNKKRIFLSAALLKLALNALVPTLRGPEGVQRRTDAFALLYGMDAYDGCATAAAVYYEQEEAREAV